MLCEARRNVANTEATNGTGIHDDAADHEVPAAAADDDAVADGVADGADSGADSGSESGAVLLILLEYLAEGSFLFKLSRGYS